MSSEWQTATSEHEPTQFYADEAGNYIQYRNIVYSDGVYSFEYRFIKYDEAKRIGAIMETAAEIIPTIIKLNSAKEAAMTLLGTNDPNVDFLTQAKAMRPVMSKMASSISDKDAVNVPFFFDEWNPDGYNYVVGDRVRFNGEVYRCTQDNESSPLNSPSETSTTVSLAESPLSESNSSGSSMLEMSPVKLATSPESTTESVPWVKL